MSVDALIGKRLNQYKIGDLVGHGDISSVYRAQEVGSDQIVAIKVLHSASFEDPTFRARFEREVRILAQIEHPHIVPIYDVGQANDLSYIVMRYLPGGNLSHLIEEYGLLLPEEVAPIIQQVADALDYTHKRGVLHRNLKPHNILFDDDRNAYITDFSLARLRELVSFITNAGYIGNPGYLAPEIATSKRVLTPAVDIYALGVILFETLTGQLPFAASSPAAQVMMHVNEPAPLPRDINPDLAPQVEMVILRGLAKDPKDRFNTAKELSQALTAAVEVTADAAQERDLTPLFNQTADLEIAGDIPVAPPETDNNTHTQLPSVAPDEPAQAPVPAPAPAKPRPRTKPPRRRAIRRPRWYAAFVGLILLVAAWFAVGVLGGIEVRQQLNQATLSAIHAEQTQTADAATRQANETLSAAIAATQSALAAMPPAALDETETPLPPPTEVAATATIPSPTPFAGSGGLVALVSERDGDSEIFILDPATSQLTQVTNNAVEDEAPRWSPDGSQLAYHSSESAEGRHIYLVDSNGQNQRQLTQGIRLDSYPQWSADGSTIAYFSVDGSRLFIRSYELASGTEQTLAQLPPGVGDVRILDWSPDGQTMTIFGFPPSSAFPELQRLALSTENRTPITDALGNINFISFSPDRALAVYTAPVDGTRELFLADATCRIISDCVIDQITDDAYNYYTPRFSPDGTLLLVSSDRVSNNLDVFVLDFEGNVVQRLTDSPFDETNAVWQPEPGTP